MDKAIVVVTAPDEARQEEIKLLAHTGEYEVVKTFAQFSRPRARFLIGRGKVEEISNFIRENRIKLAIFEDYLNSRQVMSLEEKFKIPVIDKFDLILNVFEKHAKSREARLQIELARLKRKLPYIKIFLGRKVREEHPGFGSSGEYIIHSTVSALHKRIKKIEKKLERFQERVTLQSKRRKEKGKVVSIAGYTNVGKTTILNGLAKLQEEAGDELFTTLRTKTACIKLGGEKVFVNDTLGFIRNLPHELIYAFTATLGEIKNSDLVLLVLDASEPLEEFLRKKEICENTLVNIGADHIPVVYVLNKIDLANAIEEKKIGNCVAMSAKYNIGVDELKNKISEVLHGQSSAERSCAKNKEGRTCEV
ncbi:MAG: GTPase HflX [Candidatus Hydrothermarchaeota archaeon]|nr:GTPase HflX [Candidatus Hydrothermarchaeota archaeon]